MKSGKIFSFFAFANSSLIIIASSVSFIFLKSSIRPSIIIQGIYYLPYLFLEMNKLLVFTHFSDLENFMKNEGNI